MMTLATLVIQVTLLTKLEQCRDAYHKLNLIKLSTTLIPTKMEVSVTLNSEQASICYSNLKVFSQPKQIGSGLKQLEVLLIPKTQELLMKVNSTLSLMLS